MFSIQVSWLPDRTRIFRRMSSGRTRRSALPPRWVWTLRTRVFGGMSSGADTEVRPPATLYPDPPTGVLGWAPIGLLPMQVVGLPIGTGVFRGMSSGADTEVRPPATLYPGPVRAGLRVDAQRMAHKEVRPPGSDE